MIAGEKITLSIEAAIAGGSLSLIRDKEEIGNWIGRADLSKAEELLVNIDAMLTVCSISRHDIDLIAVSAGPGSFTGIRIGIATALGLKVGLDIPMSSVSALEAIGRAASSLDGKVTQAGGPRSDICVAVPVGRDSVCIQRFAVAESQVEEITGTIVMHSALFTKYSSLQNGVDFGANIAYAVGLAASPDVVSEPLFISKGF
jgi:tRNA threonylcarbamoyl adenosine modification protein YeaZ